jgi:hypothetical protein
MKTRKQNSLIRSFDAEIGRLDRQSDRQYRAAVARWNRQPTARITVPKNEPIVNNVKF